MAPLDDNQIDRILAHSFAELSIQDAVRQNERLPLPDEGVLIQFNMIVKDVIEKLSSNYGCYRRDVISFFGIPTIVIAKLWEMILENNNGDVKIISKKEHLLWALHYMKQSPNITVLCKTMKRNYAKSPTKKTVIKWIWFYVNEIAALEEKVIVWDHRKTHDRGDDCLVSVDCIDCQFQQVLINHPTEQGKKIMNKSLYSYKFRGPALRYEIALSLLSNDIVWINGPFCPGDWNDLEIFRLNLKNQLEAGERVEADNGYVGEAPKYVVCPASLMTKEDSLATMRRVEGRHEVMNKHVKNWSCLKGYFDVKGTGVEKMEKHRLLFFSCTIAKQVSMQMGFAELYDI